jgi:hypothetical protein
MLSVGVFYWRQDYGRPGLFPGNLNFNTASTRLDLGKSTRANGFVITIPTGDYHRLEIGYWDNRGSGSSRATQPLNLFGANVRNNELLTNNYRIQNIRVAWNYLTFPVPAMGAKFRVKTFWEVQHTRIKPTVGFPESTVNPDATVGDKKAITWPGVGIGMEYVPSTHLRFEARVSGMAFPGRSRYADAEASIVGSVKSVEIFGGLKGFHFRTSPKSDTIQQGYLWGPMAGVRWVFK